MRSLLARRCDAKAITAGVDRPKVRAPKTRKPGESTKCLVTGLDGGLKTHAIDSRDRK